MTTGAWILCIAVGVALAFGLFRAMTDGRFRGTHRVHGVSDEQAVPESQPVVDSVLAGTQWADDLGERATLLQFSSAFCALNCIFSDSLSLACCSRRASARARSCRSERPVGLWGSLRTPWGGR